MVPLLLSAASIVRTVPLVASLALTLSAEPASPPPPSVSTLPILEVVKVYGRLAGSECYGRKAPPGSSCQITSTELFQSLGLQQQNSNNGVTATAAAAAAAFLERDQFGDRLTRMPFRWPLKPYGIDKSLDKTALMNKGAETALFMQQLEQAGLYDPRNPTGPLPTSLRPQLNAILQQEGLRQATVDRVYDLMAATGASDSSLKTAADKSRKVVTIQSVTENLFGGVSSKNENDGDRLASSDGTTTLDYYDFVKLLGAETISWE